MSKPEKSLAEYWHALKTVLTGKTVSLEVFQARAETCESCSFSKVDAKKIRFCGICGCKVAKDGGILNLAMYEEDLPKHGCKHPYRGLIPKSGWKE